MQTHFTEQQKTDPTIQIANEVLRKCVHCGFCTATCPTYRLTGDERESPRGRISLIQDLLESDTTPTAQTVTNLDHCLSCLSCESTCPSGVSYRRLIDMGRERIEQTYQRPLDQRLMRGVLARVLPNAAWFRRSLKLAQLTKPLMEFVGRFSRPVAALGKSVPEAIPSVEKGIIPGIYPAEGKEIKRVALILGCVQSVIAPEIDAATVRVLNRHGCTVVIPEKSRAGCCGALPHHLGKSEQARKMARQNLEVWESLLENNAHDENNNQQTIDAILMTASGCGSMLKDYSHLLTDGDRIIHTAQLLAEKVKDISQILAELSLKIEKPLTNKSGGPFIVAWQNPCSLQHGLKEKIAPIKVLEACGFIVKQPRDAHLCCGSAGTYNLLQPDFADRLGAEKTQALSEIKPDVIVSGNIGCMTQLSASLENAAHSEIPVIHLAEVVDKVTGQKSSEFLRSHI